MFKRLLILFITVSGYTVQAQQEWSFAATAPTEEACAKKIVQNLLSDARYADLNNLSLDERAGVLLTGLGTLGYFKILVHDKNGWGYNVVLYLNLKPKNSAIECAVGMDKELPYPFTIYHDETKEKIFSLKCAHQGKALNCPE